MIYQFIKQLKAKREETLYRRGWDFAAGRILEDGSEMAIAILVANVEMSKCFGDFTSFDKGIEAAIAKTKGRTYFSAKGTLKEKANIDPAQIALRKIRRRANNPGTLSQHGPKFVEGLRCAANMLSDAINKGK